MVPIHVVETRLQFLSDLVIRGLGICGLEYSRTRKQKNHKIR